MAFTPERWEAFEHDFLVLQRETKGLNDKLWRQMIQDHGFNGTPVWTVLAQPFANAVPVEAVKWLGALDVVLLGAAVGAVAWAYGAPAALWVTFFLFTGYSTRWPTFTWVFLRYDWLAGLLITMALLKRGKHAWAGPFAAWAASLRLFPVLWMLGPFARGVAGLIRGRLHRELLVFAGAFLLATAALQGLAVAHLGAEPVQAHVANMWDHNRAEQLSSRRIGLALAIPYRGEYLPKLIEDSRKDAVARQKPLRYGIAAVVLLMLGWGLRRARDDEAFGFGFVPFFLLTTASYYYYVARATLVVLHAGDLERRRNQVGLAALLALELFSNWAETRHPGHRVYLIGTLAWGLTAYTLVMTGWLLREAKDADEGTAAPDAVA